MFVAKVVARDKAGQTDGRGDMTINELTGAGMFMTSAPQ
jgi:hypothetical protein